MEIKPIKIGDSIYIIVPSEFIKVFNLNEYTYNLEVSNDGKTLRYKRLSKIDENPRILD